MAICSTALWRGALKLEDFLKEMDGFRPGLIVAEESADDREAIRECRKAASDGEGLGLSKRKES